VARGPEYLWTWPNFVAREWASNDTEVNKRFIDDPLLGQPVRCFAHWGGVAAVLSGAEALAELAPA
jgi:hypothetical protein